MRTLIGSLVALGFLLAGAAPASAHASLVRSDPSEGAVVATTPDVVTFTFDETIHTTTDSIQVFDASGDPVAATASSRDEVLTADVPDHLTNGTYVVVWRVISADSHPVAGSLTFSIGKPSLQVAAPKIDATPDQTGRMPLSIVEALTYVGLLLAGGLAMFSLLVATSVTLEPGAASLLTRVRRAATALALLAGAAVVPLTLAYQKGVAIGNIGAAWDWALVRDPAIVLALQVAGLLVALLTPGRIVAVCAAGVAVASPALVGHSRAFDPVSLVIAADVTHLLAGAVWLGGLIGLAITLRPSSDPAGAGRLLARFSTVGAAVLALLILTGAFATWRILGSWSAFVDTGYGRVLLVKLGLVCLAAAAAGLNRFVLLPRAPDSVQLVRRAVAVEAAALIGVLGLTGFLVNLSPQHAPTVRRPSASKVQVAVAGDHKVLGTMTPARRGPNTISVQVQDASGEPVTTFRAPVISVSAPGMDLGTIPAEATANGTYNARVVLPRPGTWQVAVSLRISSFDNPVAVLTFKLS